MSTGHLFPGGYRLVSSTARYPSGREVDLAGALPCGGTAYDTKGRMWAMLALEGRVASVAKPTVLRLVAYYGRYQVDEQSKTVTHLIEQSVNPDLVGQRLTRRYDFAGEFLTLVVAGPVVVLTTLYERRSDYRRSSCEDAL